MKRNPVAVEERFPEMGEFVLNISKSFAGSNPFQTGKTLLDLVSTHSLY
jgi:hypothetical protein